ncbi:hypothetical protein KEM54_000044 [Ascosphaera aggregata]|nr:hypothetical protein KEM54_000044 [Ascosphaera aggregata]
MTTPQILRIPRSDSEGGFVLVKVDQRVQSPALDLRLYATEGDTVFKGSVKASHIDRLRAKNNHSSDEEWTTILSYAFRQIVEVDDDRLVKGLELTASVFPSKSDDGDDDVDKVLSIALRKKIAGISQKLGTLDLLQSEDEISLFDWCENAVSSAASLQDELSKLHERAASIEEMNRKLKQQLDELIQAKADHDRQLVTKFAQLLNEKKLRIRNQQRLLSSLNVDSDKVKEVDEPRAPMAGKEEDYPRSAKVQPRSSKRKGRDESPGDQDFGKMDVDIKQIDSSPEPDDGRETPQPLEEDDVETASEDEP